MSADIFCNTSFAFPGKTVPDADILVIRRLASSEPFARLSIVFSKVAETSQDDVTTIAGNREAVQVPLGSPSYCPLQVQVAEVQIAGKAVLLGVHLSHCTSGV